MGDNMPNETPAASVAAGQQPTAPSSDPTTAQQTAAQTDTTQEPAASEPTEVRNPEAQRAAQEAANYRKQLRDAQKRIEEFEAKQREAELAKMSETERLQAQVAEYQTRLATMETERQERLVRAEVRAEAITRGLNANLAARLIDYAAIEYDESGDPTNIGDLLAHAVKEYGIPTTQASQASAVPPTPNPGGTNPTRQSGPILITANQYLDPEYRKQFYATHGMDITRAVTQGKVKIG